jgi:putative hydrolase of the HAD superfamily
MIKNIIFDLGGVLVKLDKNACIDSFKKLGFLEFGRILNEYVQEGVFLDFEKGLISDDDFRLFVRQNSDLNVSDNEINKAMADFLIEIPKAKLDTIIRLKRDYKVFLLSNTNPIAIDAVKRFFEIEGRKMGDYFDQLFLSYEMKLAKPDVNIFTKVLEQADILAEESLFIDDAQSNIISASSLGYKTLLVTHESYLDKEISSLL